MEEIYEIKCIIKVTEYDREKIKHRKMGNGGTWNKIEYEADVNNTIKTLNGQNYTNAQYRLPNNTTSNQNNITYQYLVSSGTKFEYCNSWRNILSVPFTHGGNFMVDSGFIKVQPKITNIGSGVNIGTVSYRGVYSDGYRGDWLPASFNTDVYYYISKTRLVGAKPNEVTYPLVALAFSVEYQTP
ncbi:Hypothetical protein ORPV_733 [Orpheovirus IHUMI-LCC2]|uniref:Uncharacterized protein n=1 Tax=Orpheovirus IHUMI-LCC2 TaxID=2023057 RepID=A0A2I2L534_9VIRU|nr:Hypothetical protein ORPV_733 [Orpheovirus IHUMI-LCC2]SNW62637.1 Hypothetical protein ORPV_733 [Orpheovirus IHUMI-LCC2]